MRNLASPNDIIIGSLCPVHTCNNVEATFDLATLHFVAETTTTSNEFIEKYRPFDKVECCFDIVAVLATMSMEFLYFDKFKTEHVHIFENQELINQTV